MNTLVKFIVSLLAVFGGVIAALAVFDKIFNKNRIKGDYLECDTSEYEETDE